MKESFIFDLNRILEEVFEAAENFRDAFKNGFSCGPGEFKTEFHWDENIDYYPAYSYPPANVYLTNEREMVFEFALSGLDDKGIDLQFKGDYMVLSARVPDELKAKENVRYFKRRLKLKDVSEQKYYVPASKFEREKVTAQLKNGLLRVVVPPKEDYSSEEGIKVDIMKEEE
ncbi:MAG: Hsp20/alpha crystallin family protein [Spirochaetales bacterium]|nr:Hsp20/alpha crystallin family protein [Spirochaetales bacterium]